MMVFWIIAGLMMLAVLAFLVPPVLSKRASGGVERKQMNVALYREQLNELDQDLQSGTLSLDQYDQTKSELEQRMLEDAAATKASGEVKSLPGYVIAGVFVLLLPGMAIGLYLKLGSPQAIDKQTLPPVLGMEAGQAGQPAAGQMEASVSSFVERLTDRLSRVPDDSESWVMLSRSYVILKQYPEAVKAFQRATQLVKNDATLLADYADALAMAQGRSLEGKPEELIQQALSVDPNNDKALYLAGTASYNRKDYKGAIKQWEKLYALLPPDSESTREIMLSILDAKARSGDKAAAIQLQAALKGLDQIQPVTPSSDQQAKPGVVGKVGGVVEITPAMKAKLNPEAKLFVYARAANGPKMPLAILNKTASALPMKFELTDAMAMTPNMKLSNFEHVQIVARVSKSGSAAPQSGDLEGFSDPVKVGSGALHVVIDHEIP